MPSVSLHKAKYCPRDRLPNHSLYSWVSAKLSYSIFHDVNYTILFSNLVITFFIHNWGHSLENDTVAFSRDRCIINRYLWCRKYYFLNNNWYKEKKVIVSVFYFMSSYVICELSTHPSDPSLMNRVAGGQREGSLVAGPVLRSQIALVRGTWDSSSSIHWLDIDSNMCEQASLRPRVKNLIRVKVRFLQNSVPLLRFLRFYWERGILVWY